MIGISDLIADALRLQIGNFEEEYTANLRAAATSAGWPVIAVAQLSVVLRNGSYSVNYPDSIREQVELLEYGTETTPPNPVIRNFTASLPRRERM